MAGAENNKWRKIYNRTGMTANTMERYEIVKNVAIKWMDVAKDRNRWKRVVEAVLVSPYKAIKINNNLPLV